MSVPILTVDESRIATANWATPPAVLENFEYQDGDIWLGRNADNDATPLGFDTPSHTLLCAGSRSKKGRALIVNNLLLWPGSVFCLDPKGENASVTAARRGDGSAYVRVSLGQKVCVLDSHNLSTVKPEYRAYYNVIDDLAAANENDKTSLARMIAGSFIPVDNKPDKTWDNKAHNYITFLLLHIVSSPDVPQEHKNLITLRRLITRGDFLMEKEYEERKKADPQRFKGQPSPDWHVTLLKSMSKNPAFDGVIADAGANYLSTYTDHKRLWESIRESAVEHSTWLDDTNIRGVVAPSETVTRSFSASEMNGNPQGISIFVCFPTDDLKEFASWPRILTNMLLRAARGRQYKKPAVGHKALMMLDEFAGLQRMPHIEQAAADIAGAKVSLFYVLQNLEQLQRTYPDGWQSFLSSAKLQIYYGFNENFSGDYVSKRLGEIEIIRKVISGSAAIGIAETITETLGGSRSTARNEQISQAFGTTSGISRGTNSSLSLSDSTAIALGESSGSNSNWGVNSSAGFNVDWGPFAALRTLALERQSQQTENVGRGGGRNFHKSKSQTRNKGKTLQKGKNEQRSQSDSRTNTTTEGLTFTDSENWSRAVAEQKSKTTTEGWGQHITKKPLATINELELLFADIEDEGNPAWPGLGLVLVPGHLPMLVHKACYDKDPYFYGLYDPHPEFSIVLPKLPAAPKPKPKPYDPYTDPVIQLGDIDHPGYIRVAHHKLWEGETIFINGGERFLTVRTPSDEDLAYWFAPSDAFVEYTKGEGFTVTVSDYRYKPRWITAFAETYAFVSKHQKLSDELSLAEKTFSFEVGYAERQRKRAEEKIRTGRWATLAAIPFGLGTVYAVGQMMLNNSIPNSSVLTLCLIVVWGAFSVFFVDQIAAYFKYLNTGEIPEDRTGIERSDSRRRQAAKNLRAVFSTG